MSFAEAASRLGISQQLIRNWKHAAEAGGIVPSPRQPSALEQENARLREENRRLLMEREILKKAAAFFAKESR